MSKELALKWLKESHNDLEMAEILLNAGKYSGSVFHSQQAAEKSSKAMLYYSDTQPWGHSIVKLLERYENEYMVEVNADLKDIGGDLDLQYTASRYPDYFPDMTPEDAYEEKSAISFFKKNYKFL